MQADISKAGSIRPGAVMALLLSLVVLGVLLAAAQTPPMPPGNTPPPPPPPPPPVTIEAPPAPVFSVVALDTTPLVYPSAGPIAASRCSVRLKLLSMSGSTSYSYDFTSAHADEVATCLSHGSHAWDCEGLVPTGGEVIASLSYIYYDFAFDSYDYHNGPWTFTCSYNWTGQVTLPDGTHQSSGTVTDAQLAFTVWNPVITGVIAEGELEDPYGVWIAAPPHVLVVQDGQVPTVAVTINSYAFGDNKDNVYLYVALYDLDPAKQLDASGGRTPVARYATTRTLTQSGANTFEIEYDASDTWHPAPVTTVQDGVWALDVEAVFYERVDQAVRYCDGRAALELGLVDVSEVTFDTGPITANASYAICDQPAVYIDAVALGHSSPVRDSVLFCGQYEFTGGIGEKAGTAFPRLAASGEYSHIALAPLENGTDNRSHTQRWGLARGWHCAMPQVLCTVFNHPLYAKYADMTQWYDYTWVAQDFHNTLRSISDAVAPKVWGYRALRMGNAEVHDVVRTWALAETQQDIISLLPTAAVWLHSGHGSASDDIQVLRSNPLSPDSRISDNELPNEMPHLEFALVFACSAFSSASAPAGQPYGGIAMALHERNNDAFIVGCVDLGDADDGKEYLQSLQAKLVEAYGPIGRGSKRLGDIHRYVLLHMEARNNTWFACVGDGSRVLSPPTGKAVFTPGT